ncbi:MAG: proton-conducting transporter membrane subunit, partial [Planctomycetota bacterium]|nr:proton-conducting transporter membrane subunit [Planctomycetota bacterium]
MDPVISKALIILFAPLAAFVVQIFFGRFLPRRGDWVPILAILVGAVLSLSIFLGPGGVMSEENGMTPVSWEINWFTIGSGTQQLRVDFGITVDNLTAMMLVVVTCIGSCIFFFSTGYMKEHGVPHARYHRFFAYLALFAFSMLGLILVNHLVFLFIFWELVGVCSYFLIGYYFEKKSAQDAANKAFLVNRVGDFGFFIGILVIFYCLGKSGLYENPLSFSALMDSVQNQHAAVWADPVFFGLPALAFAGIALFFGAVGKSAQVPLHVWLPDAMEGPTPVSALIHAATMVAAGVYMVARLFPFFAGPGFFVGD